MDKKRTGFFKKNFRLITQFAFTALTNGYVTGFINGKIYKGATKYVCVPGLNCYSCPGALGSCPLGALQATLASREFSFAFYVLGFLAVFGAVFGRAVCGFLCPFGLIQDLLYKIPFIKKIKLLPGDKYLKYLKYVILILFVILLPLLFVDVTGLAKPYFCEFICPSGTVTAGVPLVASNESLQQTTGLLFIWKVSLAVAIVLLSVICYRPFCRYLCPLGALYGLTNPISLLKYRIDTEKCVSCGMCQKACKFDIKTFKNPNSFDCIRCGDCVNACPVKAIHIGRIKK